MACPIKLGSPKTSTSRTRKRNNANDGFAISNSQIASLHKGFNPLSAKKNIKKSY